MRFLLRSLDASLEMDEASSCAQALEHVAGRNYDLILLDLNMPGLNGLDALAALRDAASDMPLVVLSGETDPRVVRAAIEGGAMGYIPKSAKSALAGVLKDGMLICAGGFGLCGIPEVLIQALRLVLAHGVYLPPLVLDAAYATPAPAPALPQCASTVLPGLTPRQMDVLRLVIRGKANKDIARELDLSEGTVKAHLSAVFQALDVHSRTEAVYAAAKLGLRLAGPAQAGIR